MKIKTYIRELPTQGNFGFEIGSYDMSEKDAIAVSTSTFMQGAKPMLAITVLVKD